MEGNLLEGIPDICVSMLLKGVEVPPNVAVEEHGVLWDDRHLRSQYVQIYRIIEDDSKDRNTSAEEQMNAPTAHISTSSISIEPLVMGIMRNKASVSDDYDRR